MKSTKENLAENVRKICNEKHISIEDLALDCDISRRHMGSISRAACNTSVDMLDKISNGTNYRVAELVSGQNCAKYEYVCVPTRKFIEYVGYADTYGIKLLPHSGNPELYFDDVSTDKDFVEKLTLILNEHQVSPVHAGDVIDDFFDEF
ncbi:MAG: helix-turn-helix transcriptional regulator [Clostridia bacterium]|nr:helix-turn-helix transcriptional regulator [Clostridia bacterium]